MKTNVHFFLIISDAEVEAIGEPIEAVEAEAKSNTIPPLGLCGKTKVVHGRIVGGKPAELHGWPWIAALGFKVSMKKSFVYHLSNLYLHFTNFFTF